MPKKVTAWACEFGCKSRVQTARGRMVAHEAVCFHNPATRSCATCYWYGDEDGLYCGEEVFDKPTPRNAHGLRTGCDKWKPQQGE